METPTNAFGRQRRRLAPPATVTLFDVPNDLSREYPYAADRATELYSLLRDVGELDRHAVSRANGVDELRGRNHARIQVPPKTLGYRVQYFAQQVCTRNDRIAREVPLRGGVIPLEIALERRQC